MPCEIIGDGWFMCSSGPLEEKPKKCAVCGKREATLLCDGRDPGGETTCDLPLCETCTTQSPLVIRLPSFMNEAERLGMETLHSQRRFNNWPGRRTPKQAWVGVGEDTIDYCPKHAHDSGNAK